jgi:Methylmalonyl-CoA mutase
MKPQPGRPGPLDLCWACVSPSIYPVLDACPSAQALRERRDGAAVASALAALKEEASAPRRRRNLLELAVTAAAARCTVGEISSALEAVWGRHAPSGVGCQVSGVSEAGWVSGTVGVRCQVCLAHQPRPPGGWHTAAGVLPQPLGSGVLPVLLFFSNCNFCHSHWGLGALDSGCLVGFPCSTSG